MTRLVGALCVLLAAAALADTTEVRARRELDRARSARWKRQTVEERWAVRTMREIEAEHTRLARREAIVVDDYRTEASLIYLDRERAANRDPFELQRERDRRLAAERYRLLGLRYYTASDFRMGSETQRMAARRGFGGTYGEGIRRAESWSIDRAIDLVWREEQRRQAIVRRVLALADKMEQEALARTAQPPRKPAWRRAADFMLQPFRRKE